MVFVLRSHRKLESAMGQNRRIGKKGLTHTSLVVTPWLREHFKLDSIAAQFLTVDPFFSNFIWSLEAMTTDNRVLIPIYEISAKEIEGYIKCFDVNIQACVIIVWADQIQGALNSQLQCHSSCLIRLDKGAKVSLRKVWW